MLFREYLNESVDKITNRMIKLLEHLRDNINEEFKDQDNKRIIVYNKIIKSKAIKKIQNFENSFVSELHNKTLDLKKVNLNELSDKEFIEWLDLFLRHYNSSLEMQIEYYLKERETHLESLELLPKRLKELAQEFYDFVQALRTIFSEIPKEDKKLLSGKDVQRIESKNYDLRKLASKMKDPILLESNVEEI